MLVIQFLLGIVVLLKGRELFWLFVAALGFVAGATLAPRILSAAPDWVFWAVALVAGIVGAALALALNRIAVGVAGFLAGGYFAGEIFRYLAIDSSGYVWLVFIVGGLIGAALMALVFDWSLIILSSFLGASLLLQTLEIGVLPGTLALVTLLGIGILVQGRDYQRVLHQKER